MRILILILFPIIGHAQWDKHVYNPNRLTLLKREVQFTGKIIWLKKQKDGDLHIQLLGRKGITMMGEFICQHTPTVDKAIVACKGYKGPIAKLRLGNRITIRGPLVYDRYHKWKEIHPITYVK